MLRGIISPFHAYFALLGAVAIGFIATGCGTTKSAEAPASNANSTNEEAPVAVTVAKVEARQVPAFIQATGSLVADEVSNIAPKVAGKVSNIAVNVGQFVSTGTVIAKIDDRDARLQLAAAQASVKQAIAGVRTAEARLGLAPNGTFKTSQNPGVRLAAANHEAALAEMRQAEVNERRYRELVTSGDVALTTYEQFKLTLDTARARAETSKELLDAAVNLARQNNEEIRSAEASVEAARTGVQIAEQAVADTVIKAPFPGFISERQVAVGEFVSTATIIATLLRTNPIKIQIQVAEADVPTVTLGRGVSLEVDAYRDRRFSGVVTAINPAIDAASRAAIVEASIENGDNSLRPGMFATARINKDGGTTGIFVPKSAVFNHQATQSYRAFVIVDGVAKLRVIQLGTEEGESVQILSGLNADETVATSNLDLLFEGARVSS